ncbi:predicted protein [Nematostella vectensis]|uniref:Uncharacterized protein n=1 Tax=Nematostella vectensis TaxID=45351 RepID=A7SPD0_NEMVE|nr:uncharacterized protein LOC5505783 [Nematostella vectensis]EDO34416.1 predicted protein [Nematostella vectensis]|eukprot:XP_001626516.1 predicted protein [Nematostella vectensis]
MIAFAVLCGCFCLTIADECKPPNGNSGDKDSVVVIVQKWETRTSNFHTSAPVMLSSNAYTVHKSDTVNRVGEANMRFYGQQLCAAVTLVTERVKDDGTSTTSTSCNSQCISIGGRTTLKQYDGSGGRIQSSDPVCCFWARDVELRIYIPPPPTTPPPTYSCIQCTGCGDKDVEARTVDCPPGDKCYTLKLQREASAAATVIKGCSHMLRYWGYRLDCDYGCKTDVKLDKDYGRRYHSVCASCCYGEKCNQKSGALKGAGPRGPGTCSDLVAMVTLTYAISRWCI